MGARDMGVVAAEQQHGERVGRRRRAPTRRSGVATRVVNKNISTYSSLSSPRMRSGSLLGFPGVKAIANDVGARGKGD